MIITDGIYICDPEKNTICRKTNCALNGGPCRLTIDKEYGVEGVEVEVVRHGWWIYSTAPLPGSPYGCYVCSICGNSVPEKTNWCSECGAKMDEEAQE